MKIERIKEIIQTGEGLKTEFKQGISSKIAREIVAFANQKGGRVLVGVSDNGEIKGYDYNNDNKSKLTDILRNNIEPKIDNLNHDYENDVLVINIPEGKNKPYSANGKFYIRNGTNSQRLNRDEVRTFFQNENQIRFGERPNSKFKINKDLSEEALNRFIKKSNLSTDIPRDQLLRNLSLKDNESLNNAGVLFFCKDVRRFFLNATVVCVLYKGSSEVDILDRKEFTGDFLSNYHNTLNYLYNKLNTEYIIKKERTERLELPEEALREVLINAMVHRDYFSTAHVQVDIYHDRVEISNPGNLLFDKKYLGKKSVPRNPIMMDLLLRADYVERIGSGIKRIEQAMDSYNLDFDIDADEFFVVTLNRKEQIERKSDESQTQIRSKPETKPKQIRSKSEAEQRKDWIIKQIKDSGRIRAKNVEEHFSVHRDTAVTYLKELIKDGIVVKKGGGSNVWYELKDNVKSVKNRVSNDTVNETQKLITKIIKDNPEVTYDKLAQMIGKSRSTIIRNMKKLKNNGIVKRVGSDKTGHWELIN